jgi:RNA polymerase sigma-70 factor (ECF subfamily)
VVPEHESVKITAGWDDLARARSGSQEAWRVLFKQYSPPLLRMAALMTGSTDAARDCVQETFIRVLSSAVHHQSGSLRAYLSTIVYRLALKENTRQSRRANLGATEPASPDPSPLDEALADERQREVARVLRTLPDHHRDILILRLHGDHSYQEISEITGLSLGTVKSRLFYAVKSAKSRLKNRGLV